jgi:hypothetical protein
MFVLKQRLRDDQTPVDFLQLCNPANHNVKILISHLIREDLMIRNGILHHGSKVLICIIEMKAELLEELADKILSTPKQTKKNNDHAKIITVTCDHA